MSTAVDNLQNLEELAPILISLGADHMAYGVKKEHYPVVMGAIIKTLKDNLGASFTPKVEKAWRVSLDYVYETMISHHYEQKEELPEDAAERLLAPPLEKGDTYRNMDSVAITNQITDR